MRLEDGLEHDFVEALLLDLSVCFGLGHRCRRAAGSPVLLGSASGSSELLSVSLPLCAHAVLVDPWLSNRLIPARSNPRCWEMQMRQADMYVVRLQVTKFLRAKVAADWLCDFLQFSSRVTVICLASAFGP